jgi:CRP-like cAMP-binding protein
MNKKEDLLTNFFRKLEARDDLPPQERQALLDASGEIRQVKAGTDFIREGDRPDQSILLARGLTARYNIVRDGGRQITACHIDGDFVDLPGFLLKTMDHGVRAMTDCLLVTFPHGNLARITEQYPHLTRLLWLTTLLDAAIHRQWLVVKGRLSSTDHMAHLFCEHLVRARVVGLERAGEFPFAITQTDLADAMGISAVHVNRTLQELRAKNLVQWEHGRLKVLDEPSLRRLGQFDETFLHVGREPR